MLGLKKYSIDDFTESGVKDESGDVWKATSLKELLSDCIYFLNKKSMLQMNVINLGAQYYHIPKYHAEIVGESIEYAWSNDKMKYRRIKYVEKKKRLNFIKQ